MASLLIAVQKKMIALLFYTSSSQYQKTEGYKARSQNHQDSEARKVRIIRIIKHPTLRGTQHQSSTTQGYFSIGVTLLLILRQLVIPQSHLPTTAILFWVIRSPDLVTSFGHCPPMGQEV